MTSAVSQTANIATVLAEQARLRPAAHAIVDSVGGRERVTTFAELDRAAAHGAALLQRTGLRTGDPVLVFQPMSAELYAVLISLFYAGLVPMFVDPSAGVALIERCCAAVAPQAMIGSRRANLLRALSPALRRIERHVVVGGWAPFATRWSAAERLAPLSAPHASAANDPALISFTSGSTGEPKVAVRTHGFLLEQHRVLATSFPGDDVAGALSLTALPVFVLADLASGCTSLIPPGNLRRPGAIRAAPVVRQILRHLPVRASASPAFWERVAGYCAHHHITLPSLRRIYLGGAPVFPHLLRALAEIAPEAEIVAVYGSTEAEPIAHVAYSEISGYDLVKMAAGSGLLAGAPVPDVAVRVLPDRWGTPLGPCAASELDELVLGPGQPGEILVRGPHVLPGYLGGRGDDETKVHVDGAVWHRTGDAGYLDARGRLWLLGRCSARIADADGTLYPFAVECAASALPNVRRVALVERAGRRALAVEPCDPTQPLDRAQLRATVGWAHIDEVLPLRRIPVDRRHNAKVNYPALRRILAEQ
jgi:acyl-CoA synthetase (AMP-forming)/AMP-acid ligase II